MNQINTQREDNIRNLLERKKKEKKNSKNENSLVNQFTTLKIEAKLKMADQKSGIRVKENNPRQFISQYERPNLLSHNIEKSQKGSELKFKSDIPKSNYKQKKIATKRTFEELEEFGAQLEKPHIENNCNNIVEENFLKRFKQNDCEKKFMNKYIEPSRDSLW